METPKGKFFMRERLSINEKRRKAPLHYWAKADNARYVAYLLDQGLHAELLSQTAADASYGGTPTVATREAFCREAALALELIIKAVIAQNLELGRAPMHVARVRLTHDVRALWQDAGLPKLSKDDQRILLHVKQLLVWSGRYAAPKDDVQAAKEHAEEDALKPPLKHGARGFSLTKLPILDWATFDRLYEIASKELWDLRENLPTGVIDLGLGAYPAN